MTDLISGKTRMNPYPGYAQLRGESSVVFDRGSQSWLVLDYHGVKRVLSDQSVFGSRLATGNHQSPGWLVFMDPPRHTLLRAQISRAFAPSAVGALEPRINAIARQLLDDLTDHGEADLSASFSSPLPLFVICEILGIPPTDRVKVKRWSDLILDLSFTMTGGAAAQKAIQSYQALTSEMRDYLDAALTVRKGNPRNDVLTALQYADIDGKRLSTEDVLMFAQLLLSAGHETTTNLINNAILSLWEHPDQLALLRSAPEEWIGRAIEETLRFRSPVQFMFRMTKEDARFDEQHIPANQLVLAVIGSANRDPNQFTEPDRFDIARTPNPHIAFGAGIHFCLGASLAKMEARIALLELFKRYQEIEVIRAHELDPHPALHVLGPLHLPVILRRRKNSGVS